MKNVLFLLFLSAAIAACNSNGSNNNSSKISATTVLTDSLKNLAIKDSANFTTVQWIDSTFHDVGDVKKGQIVEIPYVLKNTGDKPLIISSVSPGCGCTVAEKPEKPIMPGKEEKIVAKFNSEGQSPGEHSKNIIVTANTKPLTQHALIFKVNVTE